VKTLSDYHKKVLGISLNGKPPSASDETQERPVQTAGPFCFLCDQQDFEKNKELALKILKAANASEEIVVFEVSDSNAYDKVFAFGLEQEKALTFESFSELAQSPQSKKRLWGELKKWS